MNGMFGLFRLIFWIGVILTLIYFSGDIKYKDRSLRSWTVSLFQDHAPKSDGKDDLGLFKQLNRLLGEHKDDQLTDEQLKQIKQLIDERLTHTDQQSMDKLIQSLADKKIPAQAEAKDAKDSDTTKPPPSQTPAKKSVPEKPKSTPPSAPSKLSEDKIQIIRS